MEIAEIKPILTGEKVTVTISAEKNGKLRVTYADREDAGLLLFSIGSSWSGRG
jgi:hypothetical protein